MRKTRDEKDNLRRSSPSSPRSSDEEKIRRRKRREEEEEDDEYKSRKKHKSQKSSSKHRSDKEKKSGEKRKEKGRKKHAISSKLEIQELSKDDYFSKNNEFSMWLKAERKIFFSDLSSDSARDLFLEFVEEWNNKKLEPQYYEGITTGPRSSHKWKIRKW